MPIKQGFFAACVEACVEAKAPSLRVSALGGSPPPRRAHGRPVSGAALAALRGWLGRMVAVTVRVLAKECHGLGGPSACVLWQVPSGLAQTAAHIPVAGAAVRHMKVADKFARRLIVGHGPLPRRRRASSPSCALARMAETPRRGRSTDNRTT